MVEIVIVKIPLWDTILGVIYRPPDTTNDKWQEAISKMEKVISEIQSDGKFQNIILEGDMNFTGCDWNLCDNENDTNQFGMMRNIMSRYFMEQVINFPTRMDRTLDVILTNNVNMFSLIMIL